MDSSLIQNALGSASASIIARTFTHPLDTAKARLQANYQRIGGDLAMHPYRGPFDVLSRTFRTEGLRGLYRGYSTVVIGGTPGTMMYLCSYEILKKKLTDTAEARTNQPLAGTGLEFLVHFASGMAAEAFSCILYVPVDVVKERLQVQQPSIGSASSGADGVYRGSWDAVKQIMRNEGLSGIYRGYWATLGSFGPFSAFYFMFYEQFKILARNHMVKDQSPPELPLAHLILCSASAGGLASFLTSPLDMAKLRLQVQRGKLAKGDTNSQVLYRGVADCLRQVFREGGIRGLFRGAGARMLHFAPATTITMTCFEKCSSLFGRILFPDKQ